MKIYTSILCVLLGVAMSSLCLTASASTPNNILLIIADDYGIDASSLYNTSVTATLPPTPQIAALVANGVRFANAYAYPVCSPTRSCMLTGRYGFRTGTGNVVSGPSNNALKAAEFTLPEAFAARSSLGYQLKHFGKWHLGGNNMAPCTIGGWPAFAGSLAGEITSYTSWSRVVTNGTPAGTTTSTSTTYATTNVVNDAVSWIQTQTGAAKPWFAWVAFNAPHIPFHLPSPTSLWPHYTTLSGTSTDIAAQPLNYYNAAVEAMDTEIVRLLAAVDLSKTTVIFLGDNGTLYEGGVRVPMIIRGPDVVAPGRTADVLTHAVDLYSTILELAGISLAGTVPSGVAIDSQSLLPVLQNQAVTRTRLYTETSPVVNSSGLSDSGFSMTVLQNTGATQTLRHCTDLAAGFRSPVSGATSIVSGSNITFTDAAPPATAAYYSVAAETP